MKYCTNCKKLKNKLDFYKCKANSDKLMHECKDCSNTRRKIYHKNNINKDLLRNIYYRCNNKNCKDYKNYGARGIKCLITEEEISALMVRDNYWGLKKPSIDRKNNNGDYTFENCRFIEFGLNTTERNIRVSSKPVLQYTKDNKFIKEWKSAYEVSRKLKINQSDISRVCLQKQHSYSAGGFIWKYKG